MTMASSSGASSSSGGPAASKPAPPIERLRRRVASAHLQIDRRTRPAADDFEEGAPAAHGPMPRDRYRRIHREVQQLPPRHQCVGRCSTPTSRFAELGDDAGHIRAPARSSDRKLARPATDRRSSRARSRRWQSCPRRRHGRGARQITIGELFIPTVAPVRPPTSPALQRGDRRPAPTWPTRPAPPRARATRQRATPRACGAPRASRQDRSATPKRFRARGNPDRRESPSVRRAIGPARPISTSASVSLAAHRVEVRATAYPAPPSSHPRPP
jgi:hypothetical protein